MRVIILEPNKLARVAEIGDRLDDMQEIVGGYIEPYYLEDACIIVNDEGKIEKLPLNRGIYEDGELCDIIAGTAFICGLGEEDFASLTDEQVEKYTRTFKFPERFFRENGEILGFRYNPDKGE